MIQFTPEKSYEWAQPSTIAFDRVFGFEDLKNTLLDYAVNKKESVFLYGPPACGKTMLTYALAGELNAKICGDVAYQVLNGTTIDVLKKNIRRLFEEARDLDNVILFLDEIDKSCYVNQSNKDREDVLALLAQEIQTTIAYAKESGKILLPVAATCNPWDVYPPFLDKNVFNNKIHVGMMSADARRAMLEKRLFPTKASPLLPPQFELETVVAATDGFNGRELSCLIEDVLTKTCTRILGGGEKVILQEDFDKSFANFAPVNHTEYNDKLQKWMQENT